MSQNEQLLQCCWPTFSATVNPPHTAGQMMSASRGYGGSSHGYCIIKCVSNSSWPDRNISGRSLGPTHTHTVDGRPGNGRRTTTQDDLTVAAAFSVHFYFYFFKNIKSVDTLTHALFLYFSPARFVNQIFFPCLACVILDH